MIRRFLERLRILRRRTPLRGPWFLVLAFVLSACVHTRAIDAHARRCAAEIRLAPDVDTARAIADRCHEESRGMR